jgi:hypothetical protein
MRFSWFPMFLHFQRSQKFSKTKKSYEWKKAGEPENGGKQKFCVFVTVSVFSSNFGPIFCSCFWCLVLLALHVLPLFLFLCLCWCLGSLSLPFLFFSVSISVVSSLLRLALVGARPHPAEESRDALLPPLPLTKKTLL